MELTCSEVTITWYPGVPGMTDDPLVLLSTSDFVEKGSFFDIQGEQLDDPTEIVRGTGRKNYDRGNNGTTLSWNTVSEITDPMDGVEAAFTKAAALPSAVGWVKIELARKTASWQIPDVVISRGGGRTVPNSAVVVHPWTIQGGLLEIHDEGASPPTIYPDGEILLETSTATDRDALLLESAS